jgi:protein-L-isoaspartate(D-aspartate) O-methyltransferase
VLAGLVTEKTDRPQRRPTVEEVRRRFAETVRTLAAVRTASLVRALATVPREHFVGPGPWKILRPDRLHRGYETTPDDDPRRLYDGVLVALDADRQVNNGEPVSLLRWLDCLDLRPGDRLLHVGCGVGY